MIMYGLKTNQCNFQLFIPQGSIPQVSFSQTTTLCQIFYKDQHNTTHVIFQITHPVLSERQYYIHSFEPQTQGNSNMFWSLFIFRGHSTRERTSIICDDEHGDHFILRAHTGTGVSHRQHRNFFCENADEWTGMLEIGEEETPGSRRSMHGYRRTYSRRNRENLWALGSLQWGLWFLRPQ